MFKFVGWPSLGDCLNALINASLWLLVGLEPLPPELGELTFNRQVHVTVVVIARGRGDCTTPLRSVRPPGRGPDQCSHGLATAELELAPHAHCRLAPRSSRRTGDRPPSSALGAGVPRLHRHSAWRHPRRTGVRPLEYGAASACGRGRGLQRSCVRVRVDVAGVCVGMRVRVHVRMGVGGVQCACGCVRVRPGVAESLQA